MWQTIEVNKLTSSEKVELKHVLVNQSAHRLQVVIVSIDADA